MQYVCGFYMNFAMDQFLLIKKAAPEWMADKWNGVGGKINRIIRNEKTGATLTYNKDISLIAVPDGERISDYHYYEETPYQAMCREFKEETGIETKEYEWHCFHIKQFANDIKVYYFAAFGDKFKQAKSMTSEPVTVFDLLDLMWDNRSDFIYDVPYLVSMIRAEMKNNNFITLNPEGINDDKYRTKTEDFGSAV